MRAVIAYPTPQLAVRSWVSALRVFDSNERERESQLLTQSPKLEIDHLGPGACIDVLLSVRIDLVHGLMRVTKDHRLELGLAIEQVAGGVLQVLEKLGLLPQDIESDLEPRAALRAVHKPGSQEIKRAEEHVFERENRIHKKTEQDEQLHRPDFVQVLALGLQSLSTGSSSKLLSRIGLSKFSTCTASN